MMASNQTINADQQTRLRNLPSVDALAAEVLEALSTTVITKAGARLAARLTIDCERQAILNGSCNTASSLNEKACSLAVAQQAPSLPSVLNGTGVLLHTGLGRSMIAPQAARSMYEASICNAPIEIDLESTARGNRADLVRPLLCELTGCESATVVNNNAAAVLLCFAAVGRGKEVVVSRGELVEIGGSFRMPDVMESGGAILREVGTTNRTHLADYERAIGEQTAALLKVHPSNYRIDGFTSTVPIHELVELGRRHDCPVIDDIGSGALDRDMLPYLSADEPTARDSIESGADLVMFSGDKLLGGPQAGIIVGRKKWIDVVEKHPLMRTMRMDKVRIAGLVSTLQLHALGTDSRNQIPLQQMVRASVDELQLRGRTIADSLKSTNGIEAIDVIESEAFLGAGSMPTQSIDSRALAIQSSVSASLFAKRLRTASTPLLPRIADELILVDLRSILPHDDAIVRRCLTEAAGDVR